MSDYKIAIVGGGVSGLYAAWRLCDAKVREVTQIAPKEIILIEGSKRTSGRLYTKQLDEFGGTASPYTLPSNTGLRAELGGMRFLNYHQYVSKLAAFLKIPVVHFQADSPENWHYLRGKAFQSLTSADTRYALSKDEQGLSPGTIIYNALVQSGIVDKDWLPSANVTLRSLVDHVLKQTYGGKSLGQLGFWDLVIRDGNHSASKEPYISNEAYELFADAGAYDTIAANWNAATAVVDMVSDFGTDPAPTYYALEHGYMALSERLLADIVASGVTVATEQPVTRLGRFKTGPYQLWVEPKAYTADNVILALPPRAISLIKPVVEVIDPLAAIRDDLQRTSPIPLLKIFLVYKSPGTEPWWSSSVSESEWPQFTRMTTDLPMRQIYNFGSYYDKDAKCTYSLLQASYSDGLKAGYWAGLLSGDKGATVNSDIFADLSPATGLASLGSGMVDWRYGDGTLEDHPVFARVHDQFVALLNAVGKAKAVPQKPIAGTAIDWATDPFGGGVNFWNVGVDLATQYNGALYPNHMDGGKGAMFIVGEGYSLLQGWVEGALWTVEDALKQAYSKWPAPDWLK